MSDNVSDAAGAPEVLPIEDAPQEHDNRTRLKRRLVIIKNLIVVSDALYFVAIIICRALQIFSFMILTTAKKGHIAGERGLPAAVHIFPVTAELTKQHQRDNGLRHVVSSHHLCFPDCVVLVYSHVHDSSAGT